MIRLLYPNAKIIHCRRHPVDNCLSIYTNSMNESHIRYKSDLRQLGLYYRQYFRADAALARGVFRVAFTRSAMRTWFPTPN